MWKLDYYIDAALGKSLYKRFPFIKYKRDTKFNNDQFAYYNFWYWFNYKKFWISEFIKKRWITNKSIDYISVFGPRKVIRYLKNKKVFYTAEDIGRGSINWFYDYNDYLLEDVDLSIWFREYRNKNYIRFPLRITQLITPWMQLNDIEKLIDEINDRKNICRTKFCTLIARHDKSWERERIYKKLEKYWHIDCPSKFLHNLDINLPYYEEKRKFMEDYRFNICLENHSIKWYVTEKLIDALLSKCIPIYNWILTDFDKQVINEEAIINTMNSNRLKQVEELELDINNYENFISIKPFKKDAPLILNQKLNELESKLRKILN